jgi:hypothetical protein
MRILLLAALAALLGAAPAAGAEEEGPRFADWHRPDEHPILARLRLTAEQRKRLRELGEAYEQQKAEIEKKHAGAQGLGQRAMMRELLDLDDGAAKQFLAVLTPDQERRRQLAERIIKECRERLAAIDAEVTKREPMARFNPTAYFDFKKQCEAAKANWEADRDRKLEGAVGKLPEKKPAEGVEKIDLDAGGTYKSGEWEYVLRVEEQSGKVTGRHGSLTRDGKGLHLEKPGTELETPWGKMKNLGPAEEGRVDSGWMPAR